MWRWTGLGREEGGEGLGGEDGRERDGRRMGGQLQVPAGKMVMMESGLSGDRRQSLGVQRAPEDKRREGGRNEEKREREGRASLTWGAL